MWLSCKSAHLSSKYLISMTTTHLKYILFVTWRWEVIPRYFYHLKLGQIHADRLTIVEWSQSTSFLIENIMFEWQRWRNNHSSATQWIAWIKKWKKYTWVFTLGTRIPNFSSVNQLFRFLRLSKVRGHTLWDSSSTEVKKYNIRAIP